MGQRNIIGNDKLLIKLMALERFQNHCLSVNCLGRHVMRTLGQQYKSILSVNTKCFYGECKNLSFIQIRITVSSGYVEGEGL